MRNLTYDVYMENIIFQINTFIGDFLNRIEFSIKDIFNVNIKHFLKFFIFFVF